jgi:hypothetical protein
MARGGRRWAGIVPVFLASVLAANLVLPASSRQALPVLRLLALPAELAAIVLVIWRVRRGLGNLGTEDDVIASLDRAFRGAVPNPRLASVLAFEAGVLYYGLFSWRDQPRAGNGQAFSYHRAGNYGTVAFALVIISICEIVGMHLAVSLASRAAAWLVTALGLYGTVWIIGDYHAARLRPIVFECDRLLIRIGLRWSLAIPISDIAAVVPAGIPPRAKRAPGHLNAALLMRPQVIIELRRSLVALGPYGVTKAVSAVSLAVDDRAGLRKALVDRGLMA